MHFGTLVSGGEWHGRIEIDEQAIIFVFIIGYIQYINIYIVIKIPLYLEQQMFISL